MKKIALIAYLGCIASVFSLASCGSDSGFIFKDNNQTQVDDSNHITNVSSTSKEEPVYNDVNLNINTDSTPSTETTVELAVGKIYDSVVSLSCTLKNGSSAGSGVLFSYDNSLGFAYIVTCYHVIENTTSINAVLTDNTKLKASVVGAYADEDLAVLAIKPNNVNDLTYAKLFNDSDSLKLGSQVVCIGNPLGTLPGSVSVGYVSYINRKILNEGYKYQRLIQTDVSINSGNSGGGLFNTYGNLIGIVNAKYSSSSIEGLGFAIPSNTVKNVITDFIETAKYDSANDEWSCGYVKGDWEFGFSLNYAQSFSGSGLYVYSCDTSNSYASGGVELKSKINYYISNISIDYKDSAKEDLNNLTYSSAQAFYTNVYDLGLTSGDTIKFNFKDGTSTSFTLKQYKYSF